MAFKEEYKGVDKSLKWNRRGTRKSLRMFQRSDADNVRLTNVCIIIIIS